VSGQSSLAIPAPQCSLTRSSYCY